MRVVHNTKTRMLQITCITLYHAQSNLGLSSSLSLIAFKQTNSIGLYLRILIGLYLLY